jgi:hypothetical protein
MNLVLSASSRAVKNWGVNSAKSSNFKADYVGVSTKWALMNTGDTAGQVGRARQIGEYERVAKAPGKVGERRSCQIDLKVLGGAGFAAPIEVADQVFVDPGQPAPVGRSPLPIAVGLRTLAGKPPGPENLYIPYMRLLLSGGSG